MNEPIANVASTSQEKIIFAELTSNTKTMDAQYQQGRIAFAVSQEKDESKTIDLMKATRASTPEIVNSKWWQQQLPLMTVREGKAEVLDYLLTNTAMLDTNAMETQELWSKILQKDDLKMWQVLEQAKLIPWLTDGKKHPHYLDDLLHAPRIAELLVTKYGFEIGFKIALGASYAEPLTELAKLDRWDSNDRSAYLQKWLNFQLIQGAKQTSGKGLNSWQTSVNQATWLQQYPTVVKGSVVEAWDHLLTGGEFQAVQKLIKQQITPSVEWLVDEWYWAVRQGKGQIMEWLMTSPELVKQIKATWPMAARTGRPVDAVWGSFETLEILNNHGFDLLAINDKGTPWIHQVEMFPQVISWLVTNKPEVFDSVDGIGRKLIKKVDPYQNELISQALRRIAKQKKTETTKTSKRGWNWLKR